MTEFLKRSNLWEEGLSWKENLGLEGTVQHGRKVGVALDCGSGSVGLLSYISMDQWTEMEPDVGIAL